MAHAPSQQQVEIVKAAKLHKIIKIEAGAGCAKTTTLTFVAEDNPAPSLYLAFNKVTADEGTAKFPKHVTCRTTHSVAYGTCAGPIRQKLQRPHGGYRNVAGTGSEIAKFYKVDAIQIDEDLTCPASYLGLMAKVAVARFEQSADGGISLEHVVLGDMADRLKAAGGGSVPYVKGEILKVAKKLWRDRIDPKSEVLATHDTYLKLYQLSKPVLTGYDILYVDEFQDTTPCVLDIVLRQKEHMRLVVVGDRRQAIYSWRGAINAMELIDCPSFALTKSFRYGQAVADVATAILEGEMTLTGNETLATVASYVGTGRLNESKPYTRLFRTNAALLSEAVAAIQAGVAIAIEINVADFVKCLESGLSLYQGDMKKVKHDKFLAYTDWADAKGEAKNDAELGRIVKIIESGQGDFYVRTLSSFKNSPNPEQTFTTAHKSKGREWRQVRIEADFRPTENEDGEWIGLSTEEQNLLYVACTRAQMVLEYNIQASKYVNRWLADELPESRERSVAKVMGKLFSQRDLLAGGYTMAARFSALNGEQAQIVAEMEEGPRWADPVVSWED